MGILSTIKSWFASKPALMEEPVVTVPILDFPPDCTSAAEQTEYCYRAQEVLRLKHNIEGKKFHDGSITADDWQTFLTTVFEPKQAIIITALLQARAELKKSTKWNITLDTIKEEEVK